MFENGNLVGIMTSPQDAITPAKIEHNVDEGIDQRTGEPMFRHNLLVYTFEIEAGHIEARGYLDTGEVSIFLPEGMQIDHADALRVLHVLKRRYRVIQLLAKDGYETVWRQTSRD